MNRALLVVAFVATALLAGVLYELHGINQRLDLASARNWGLPVLARQAPAAAETPEQRKRRLDAAARELERWQAEYDYIKAHAQTSKPNPEKPPR